MLKLNYKYSIFLPTLKVFSILYIVSFTLLFSIVLKTDPIINLVKRLIHNLLV